MNPDNDTLAANLKKVNLDMVERMVRLCYQLLADGVNPEDTFVGFEVWMAGTHPETSKSILSEAKAMIDIIARVVRESSALAIPVDRLVEIMRSEHAKLLHDLGVANESP